MMRQQELRIKHLIDYMRKLQTLNNEYGDRHPDNRPLSLFINGIDIDLDNMIETLEETLDEEFIKQIQE
jgi:hypothetical protein